MRPRALSFKNLFVLNEFDIRNGWVAAIVRRRHRARDFEVVQVFRSGSEARGDRAKCATLLRCIYAETQVLEFHEADA